MKRPNQEVLLMKKKTEKKVKEAVKACCEEDWSKKCDWKGKCDSGCGGCAYFLGFLGAAIYYISTATGFWAGVLGFLKACIWPLFLVLEALKFVGA
jgi:hypothetical protein